MTVTANLGTASDNQSLMSHTDVTPVNEKTQEQSSLIEIDTANTQDLTAVLGKVLKCPHYNCLISYVGGLSTSL